MLDGDQIIYIIEICVIVAPILFLSLRTIMKIIEDRMIEKEEYYKK